jgi:predicted metal-dependent phosphoesterase TrpH
VIDLHSHTTASDGRSAPDVLIQEAAAAGVTTLAVTDHDTVAGLAVAGIAARAAGMTFVPGIEVTAVHEGRDVHVLGYYIDAADEQLQQFLDQQRADRRRRLSEILERLQQIGVAIDTEPLLARAADDTGKAVGRPMVAEALVTAGHARDIAEAFHLYLGDGRPAFVERSGVPPAQVISIIRRAGGLASLAHPGKTRIDALVSSLADNGLTALEVYHPDHDAHETARYREMAARYDLLVTGGSDYHGPGSGREAALGRTGLPAEDFARLMARARRSPSTGPADGR